MNLYGRLSVSLAEERGAGLESLAQIINNVIRPPAPVSADDIYVRAIYLVSDQVNSYGGRFPEDELQNLCRLIIDSPVLVGHNKNELPIARNFKAEVQAEDGRSWVKVWFYWLKDAEGSEALRANIDGGIYKEGSIGFIFNHPECGICGEDIRNCSHTPLKKYDCAEGERVCHYNYRGIEKVLETSLVFRGANPDTRITNELLLSDADSNLNDIKGPDQSVPIYFDDFPELDQSDEIYAAPLLLGVPVESECNSGAVTLCANGASVKFGSDVGLNRDLRTLSGFDIKFGGQLFKMRGKQRLPLYLWTDFDADSILQGRYFLRISHILNRDGSAVDDATFEQIKDKIKSLPNISLKLFRKIDTDLPITENKFQSRYGCELIARADAGQKRMQIRTGRYLLLKVIRVNKPHGRKFSYDLAFEDDSSQTFTSYETGIKAAAEDTVLVRATDFRKIKALNGIIIEDNLGKYYRADCREALRIGADIQSEYTLYIVREAGLLHIKTAGLDSLVLFPQFNPASLNDNKTLIGYPLKGGLKNQQFDLTYRKTLPAERGRVRVCLQTGRGHKLELSGQTLGGKFKLTPAHWAQRELVLFSRIPE